MKKFLIIISIVIGIILFDSIQALVLENNPIIKIKEYYNGGNLNYKSKGLLVDTYNCTSGERVTVIKGFSYSCSYAFGNYVLIDNAKYCASMKEQFYQDDIYIYYFDCIKSHDMLVKYDNGFEETISDALRQGHIVIQDLDKFDIYYIKEEK